MGKSLEEFKRYGWMVNEENLDTLPEDANEGAKNLAKWLTLEGRRKALVQWLENYNPDTGRIHGQFWHIGSWTHRMAHTNPNQANISAVFNLGKKWHPQHTVCPESPREGYTVGEEFFEGEDAAYEYGLSQWLSEPHKAVDEVKAKYDRRMRACWGVPEDRWQVGADAEGIQLRILAHLMRSEDYRDAITKGNKEDKTDIHNLNLNALGLSHLIRDDAKTFIYAWLLGAGIMKISSILKCSTALAKTAEQNFLRSLPELKRLKEIDIKRDASRGYFIGLDGRRVPCSSEHLMLAGYLQNGEKVCMAKATMKWYKKAQAEGINFMLVDLVHDEWQVEVVGSKEDAERMGEIMCEALEETGRELKLFCPLAGSYSIGKNWAETH